MMISCVTFEYSKNTGCPVAIFFRKLAARRKKFPRRSESILTGKPAYVRSDFPCSSVAAGVPPAILRACAFRVRRCLLRVASQFGRETGGGSAILNAELWINSFEMFSDSRRRNSED